MTVQDPDPNEYVQINIRLRKVDVEHAKELAKSTLGSYHVILRKAVEKGLTYHERPTLEASENTKAAPEHTTEENS